MVSPTALIPAYIINIIVELTQIAKPHMSQLMSDGISDVDLVHG